MPDKCCTKLFKPGGHLVCSLSALVCFLISGGLLIGGIYLLVTFRNFENVQFNQSTGQTVTVTNITKFSKYMAGIGIIVLAFLLLIPPTIACWCVINVALECGDEREDVISNRDPDNTNDRNLVDSSE